ncbi:uncharacterized protein PAC_11290 [Phialocephala subalpina]|uniref:F-box domain-containing protein n=1 Tax=Phialocephala subalpina TaxID=576137 RepID=A0A1L7X8P8_9HELO|nr:uncharacterized protein PAC_11290 [Phialocephala subalpina]
MASQAASQSSDPDRNANSKLLVLPIEVKLRIVEHLSLADAKQVRFISESWATAGRDTFFKSTYHIRPHRTDLTKLREICDSPELARNIETVKFWVPDFDKHRLVSIWHEENPNPKDVDKAADEISALRSILDKSTRPGVQQQYKQGKKLHECLSRLSNLKRVEVRASHFPFPSRYLGMKDIWKLMRKGYTYKSRWRSIDPVMSYHIYIQPILAAIRLEHVEWLDLWSVPLEAWIQVGENLKRRSLKDSSSASVESGHGLANTNVPVISHIKTLHLQLQQGDPDLSLDARLARSTVQFLGAFRNLRYLSLAMWMKGNQAFNAEATYQSSRLYFPHLESVDFSFVLGLNMKEEVCDFLYKHKATLKNLAFYQSAWIVRQKFTRAILTEFRDNLSLEKFFFRTLDPVEYLTGAENNQYDRCTLYDSEWKERPYNETEQMRTMNLIELYVCGKIEWPLVDDEPKDQYGNDWEPKIRLTHSEFKQMSMLELNLRISGKWPPPVINLPELTFEELVNRVKEKRKPKLREVETIADEKEEEAEKADIPLVPSTEGQNQLEERLPKISETSKENAGVDAVSVPAMTGVAKDNQIDGAAAVGTEKWSKEKPRHTSKRKKLIEMLRTKLLTPKRREGRKR